MQSVEKTFQLTRVDKELLAKQEYDVQVGWYANALAYEVLPLTHNFQCITKSRGISGINNKALPCIIFRTLSHQSSRLWDRGSICQGLETVNDWLMCTT